jgi:DNA-directed RNA polymerase specialized sigma24 family protein
MTKQELRQCRKISKELAQLDGIIAALQQRLFSPKAPRLSHAPVKPTGGRSDFTDISNKKVDIEEIYTEKRAALAELLVRFEVAIEILDSDERRLMRGRYIEGDSWKQIANKMNYGKRHITRMHGRILRKLERCP